MAPPVLDIRDLRTWIRAETGTFPAVDGVSLRIELGETFALVGQSGGGKTLLALSVIGLLPADAEVVSGEVWFEERDLLREPPAHLRSVRGGKIAMVFQGASSSLNPVLTVGEQIAERLRLNGETRGADLLRSTVAALREVGIPDPEERVRWYPHQFSVGMCQRVCVAMALAGGPALLIADEPTSALDVTVAAQVMGLLGELRSRRALSMLLISHDLRAVEAVADRVAVMYSGQIVEISAAREFFDSPLHPYSEALLACGAPGDGVSLEAEPGANSARPEATSGCRFAPRCGRADESCLRRSPELVHANGRACRCLHPLQARPGLTAGRS